MHEIFTSESEPEATPCTETCQAAPAMKNVPNTASQMRLEAHCELAWPSSIPVKCMSNSAIQTPEQPCEQSTYLCTESQTYIRPNASSKELLLVTRITVFVFGMFTGVLSIILFVVSALPSSGYDILNQRCSADQCSLASGALQQLP